MSILCTERGPADLTLKHDGTQAPPVTILSVAMTTEDLGGNVVRSADGGVGHESTRLTPVVDSTTITNSEIDLIKIDRITIARSAGLSLEQALII